MFARRARLPSRNYARRSALGYCPTNGQRIIFFVFLLVNFPKSAHNGETQSNYQTTSKELIMKTSHSLAAMRSATKLFAITIVASALVVSSHAATYYSQGSVDPTVLANWNDVPAGGGASPANFVTVGDVFIVQTGHNMTNTVALAVTGTIQIQNGATLVAGGGKISAGTGQIDNGGTFIVAYANGANGSSLDILGTNKVYGASSTVEIQRWGDGTGGTLNNLPGGTTWGNFVVNITNTMASAWQQAGVFTNVQGNLIVKSLGSTTNRDFRLNSSVPATLTVNIGGDIHVSGGSLNLISGTSIATINVGGTIQVTGGIVQSTGAGVPIITVAGNSGKISVTGGGTNLLSGNYANPPASPVADAITLDNGAFGASGVDFTLTTNRGITLGAGGGILTMLSGRTLTVPGNITGPGALTKGYASGTTVNLTLSGMNDFLGDFTITGGGVRFNSDAVAGRGTVRVTMPVGGTANTTLRNTGVPTSTLTNNVEFNANNGLLITLDSDTVNTFIMSGNFSGVGAVRHGVNSGGTVVLSGDNSAWSGGLTQQRGNTVLGHKNALGTGTLIVAPATNSAAQAVSLSANTPLTGVNAVTNPITLAVPGSGTNWTISGANDLQLSGPIALSITSPVITNNNSGATILSGIISGTGFGLTTRGTGTMTLSGANTFDGGVTIASGTVKLANVSGSATGSGAVSVASGAFLSGNGTASGAVTVNGTIAPGSSVGALATGGETWAGGGHYVFEVNQAAGTAGVSPGWDKLNITGSLNITATSGSKFNIDITSLTLANAAGAVSDFDNTNSYSWVIASTTTGVTGFDTNAFALNTAGFVNSLGSGSFSLSTNGNNLLLNFTVPNLVQDPTSFVTTGAGQGTFAGSPNTTYTIQYADALGNPTNWQLLNTVLTDGSGVGVFSDPSAPNGQSQRFYRVKYP